VRYIAASPHPLRGWRAFALGVASETSPAAACPRGNECVLFADSPRVSLPPTSVTAQFSDSVVDRQDIAFGVG
jgi:hypothetical protein